MISSTSFTVSVAAESLSPVSCETDRDGVRVSAVADDDNDDDDDDADHDARSKHQIQT